MKTLSPTYRAPVFETTRVRRVDKIQTPKLARLRVFPVDKTFGSLLHRRPYNVKIYAIFSL